LEILRIQADKHQQVASKDAMKEIKNQKFLKQYPPKVLFKPSDKLAVPSISESTLGSNLMDDPSFNYRLSIN
jgi:hypothetical protein